MNFDTAVLLMILPAVALIVALKFIIEALAILEGVVKGRGQRLVHGTLLAFPISLPLLIVAPVLGIACFIAACACFPFGLLWLGSGAARISRRVQELELLHASLTAEIARLPAADPSPLYE